MAGSFDRRRLPPAGAWLLTLIWALEIFLVQEATLGSGGPRFIPRILRAALDLAFCAAWVAICRRWVLALAFAATAFVLPGLLAYHRMFGRPLEFAAIAGQGREGLRFGEAVLSLVAPGALWALAAALVVKLALLPRLRFGPRSRLPAAAAALSIYAAAAGVASLYRPIPDMRRFMEFGRIAATWGYLWPSVYQGVVFSGSRQTELALQGFSVRSARMTRAEGPLPPSERIVVIQVESLDWDVLGRVEGGIAVAPFLSSLRDTSMTYRVQALHWTGSADADFLVLTDRLPSQDITIYKVRNIPFSSLPSLPRLLAARGYATYALHGNTAGFFGRGGPYRELGFEHLLFRGALMDTYHLPTRRGFIEDRQVLSVSRQLLATREPRQFHFLITLSSHAPYEFHPDEVSAPFPRPAAAWQRYLDAIHYVDGALQDYVAALPPGTLLVLYGDHESRAGYPGKPASAGEFVPVLIHRTGDDLSPRRQLPAGLALSGELTLHDVADYLHHRLGEMRLAAAPLSGAERGR